MRVLTFIIACSRTKVGISIGGCTGSLLRPVVVYWRKNRASYKQTALTIFFELGNHDVDHTFHPLL